jgi:hypothetical protein
MLALITATAGFGQTTSGTIIGTLLDPTGAVVPQTQITLINVATSTKSETMTDSSGYYQFFSVPPGSYKITVKKTGFKQLSQGPFEVQVESSMRVNLNLEVGSETLTVTVNASSPLIQAEGTNLGSVVDERETTELPLNGRNPMNLTALVPSVVPQGQTGGNTNGANPFAWGNYQIGGGMANQSATYIDGSPVNTTYINLTALVPTQDSLAEFKVDTNSLPAEYGHLAGGAIQFSTKSGSNSPHGAMWEYIRNKVLDGNTFFNKLITSAHPTITERGPFTQNQFGFNIGGPVVIPHVYNGKNKTFFFFNYEGFYNRQAQTVVNTVPTATQIAGDLSDIATEANAANVQVVPQIYDPNSTCTSLPCNTAYPDEVNVGDRHAIPNNDLAHYVNPVDASLTKINPVAVAYLNTFYPVSKVASTFANGNYVGSESIGGQNFEYVAKIDHQVSDKNHISSRYTFWKNKNLPQDPLGTGMCQDRCAENFQVNNWVLNDTHVFNPTTILDVRLSYMRFVYDRVALLTSYSPATIGQTLGNGTSPEYPGPMMISIGGYDTANTFGSGGGDSTINNASDNDRIAGTLTKIIRKHTFKFGGEYLRATFNYSQSNNSGGQGSVDTTFTQNNHTTPDTTSPTGAALASFLLGYPNSIGYNTVAPVTSEMLYSGVFATDDWRLTSKLTAHLGIRWENGMPWTDRFNNISYFDPSQTNPILAAASATISANVPGFAVPKGSAEVVDSSTRSSRSPQDTYNKQFSPRVGFTYSLRPSTVVSGGYGVLWIPLDVGFNSSPNNDPINAYATQTVPTTNGGQTPDKGWNFATPLPGGIIQPPKRSNDPVTGFQYVLLGSGVTENFTNNPYPYAQQWNFGVQQQFGSSFVLDVAYAGAKGTHLPFYGLSRSALPDSYLTADADTITNLAASSPNPFYNKTNPIINPNYALGAPTVTNSHLLSPYPQYNGVSQASADYADSTYHSMQVKLTKRFTGGASISAGYTYAKLISSTDTLTGWLESSDADVWGVSDPNNLALEKSLSSNDVRNRLVVSYVYDLPFGRGKAILPNISRAADAVVGGWGLEGVSTFQTGWPVSFGENTNTNSPFGFGQRPTVVSGCNRTARPSGQALWNMAFNTDCFAQTPQAQFGEPRNDSSVKGPGIDNWDTSIFKNVSITKEGRASLQFRAEFFNVWNHTQFGMPNATQGGGSFGQITSQANQPRLVQFALRIKY